MRAQRQFEKPVVIHDLFAERHGREPHRGFARNRNLRRRLRRSGCRAEQRQIVVAVTDAAERLRRPQRLAPTETERAEGVGIGEACDDARRQAGA